MCLFKALNCDRGSKWAKPCSEFLHSALLLRKILRGWENSFKTGPSPAVTSRDWQNSEYCVAVQKHWQKGGDGEYRLVAVTVPGAVTGRQPKRHMLSFDNFKDCH